MWCSLIVGKLLWYVRNNRTDCAVKTNNVLQRWCDAVQRTSGVPLNTPLYTPPPPPTLNHYFHITAHSVLCYSAYTTVICQLLRYLVY